MKKVAEKHTERKETEEVFRHPAKVQKARMISERKSMIHGKTSVQQISLKKSYAVFRIPVKAGGALNVSQIQPPHLKAKFRTFFKPKIISVRMRSLTMVIPIVPVKCKAPVNVSVPVFPPIMLHKLTAPPPELKPRPILDISVKPLIRPELIRGLGKLKPTIKSIRTSVPHPYLIPTSMRKSRIICIPRIHTTLACKEEAKVGVRITTTIQEPERPFKGMESILELILEEKSGKGIGSAMKYSEEPVYIVLAKPFDDEYECLETLYYFCIRTLRECLDVLQSTRFLSSEYGRTEVEKYLKEREITIVDEKALSEKLTVKIDSDEKSVPQLRLILKELNEEALADRIREIGEGLRYIIFHVSQDSAGLLYNKLWSLRSKFHDRIFWVEPATLPAELRKRIAELAWAFVDIPSSGSYDQMFGGGKLAYYRKLEDIGREVDYKPEKPYPILRTHRLGSESVEHYLLKKFLAKYLVDKPPHALMLSKIVKEERYKLVTFEKEWWSDNQLVAVSDVYIEGDSAAIEIETLFEEGKYGGDPVAKIRDETVDKYKRFQLPVRRLWIVMENITVLRHLKRLWTLLELYKRWYREGKLGFEVSFLTLDLKKEELIPLEKLLKILHEIRSGWKS